MLYRILNEAEEQEISEAALAYAFLWKSDQVPQQGVTAAELDQIVESFLKQTTDRDVDFEIDDALAKLARLGVAHVNRDGYWTVIPIDHTEAAMAEHWQREFETAGRNAATGPLVDQDLFNDRDFQKSQSMIGVNEVRRVEESAG